MTEKASPAASPPTSGPVASYCSRCGYDLRDREACGTCPECGDEYSRATVLSKRLPGPVMLCLRYLWPFLVFAILVPFQLLSNDAYAIIGVLFLFALLLIVLIVNGIVQRLLLQRHAAAGEDGRRRPIASISGLAAGMTFFAIVVPSLFLAGCLLLFAIGGA